MNSRAIAWGLAFSAGLNLVLITMAATLFAQGSWQAPRARAEARTPMTDPMNFREADETRLKLTPAQRQQFRLIREKWFLDEQQAKGAGEARIARIGATLARDDGTTASLKPMFDEIREHSDDYFQRLTHVLQDYRAELTPRQRVIFNRMLRERFDALKQYTRQKNLEYKDRIAAMIQRERRKDQKQAGILEKKAAAKGAKKAVPIPTPTPGGN